MNDVQTFHRCLAQEARRSVVPTTRPASVSNMILTWCLQGQRATRRDASAPLERSPGGSPRLRVTPSTKARARGRPQGAPKVAIGAISFGGLPLKWGPPLARLLRFCGKAIENEEAFGRRPSSLAARRQVSHGGVVVGGAGGAADRVQDARGPVADTALLQRQNS